MEGLEGANDFRLQKEINMSFPKEVADRALTSCARSCCICHKFCGLKMELHHIVLQSEGGANNDDNCIPLCLDCHTDMRSYDHHHPKGRKYSREELRKHRFDWYESVQISLGRVEPASAIPGGQYQGMVLQMVTNNQVGWAYPSAHAMVPDARSPSK